MKMCTLSMRPPIPPPNVPQARPIENLWGILAQKVYEGEWEAKTQQELISRIQSQLKNLTQIFYKALWEVKRQN